MMGSNSRVATFGLVDQSDAAFRGDEQRRADQIGHISAKKTILERDISKRVLDISLAE
jgi:hypothetical protein